jgi:hypothetical protein
MKLYLTGAGIVMVLAGGLVQAQEHNGGLGNAVDKEVKGLTAEDFSERQAALQRLEHLIADQVKQRAQVQEIVDALMKDLAQQQQALAMVSGDEEARARIAGLLETERGLAGWAMQTMNEPEERRKTLLAWGLGKEGAPVAAKVYAVNRRIRLEGIGQLAKMEDGPEGGASWTLGRVINDGDAAVRAKAMAEAWTRKPTADVVAALWFRAVAGPLQLAEQEAGRAPLVRDEGPEKLKVEFPEGDPLEFEMEEDGGAFTDALLAGDVLVHLNSPLVAERVKEMLHLRVNAGKSLVLPQDDDWTLAMHRLVEAYQIKEAVPVLAQEALARETEDMAGESNGRPYTWSRRTLAVGVLCKLIGKDPADFSLIHVQDADLRGWLWATDVNPQMPPVPGGGDVTVVRAFYKWWKDHHGEYGVKEEPSTAGLPPERRIGRGRLRGDNVPSDPATAPAE